MFRLRSPQSLAIKIFALSLTAFISFGALPGFSTTRAATSQSTVKLARSRTIPSQSSSAGFDANNLFMGQNTSEPAAAGGDFVIEYRDGESTCREATPAEAQELSRPVSSKGLHRITPIRTDATGLNIVLIGTAQLEQNQAAKAAFIRAAANWQALIQTPITIIINVDYGPTRFGTPYPANVLGSTSSQLVVNPVGYDSFRSALTASASNNTETSLYSQLSTGSMSTDIGNISVMAVNSSTLRAVGLMSPNANPDGEASFGNLPAIGFNSDVFGSGTQAFDFDPGDGIDSGKIDFDATATHEIGHALGFTTLNGGTSNPAQAALTAWDFFRFNANNPVNFATSPRMTQAGGSQVFYGGGNQLGLSTGGPSGNAAGGDGWQSSHWKHGAGIGIMDPAITTGVRQTITANDVAVLNSIGYWVVNEPAPTLPQNSPGSTVNLSSGVAQNGSLTSAPANSCFVSPTQYAIQVPAGATQLKIDLSGNQDVDLHVRFGQRVLRVVGWPGLAEYISDSPNTSESITITPSSSAPLQAGTYFIALDNCGSNASFTLTANVTAPASPPNPIDDGRTFVRQQYLDFLGREPDQAGWDYWTGQIANCGTNQQCIHDQRIGVSAAYFFSDEFQKTGYFVYLLYKSSLTRQPNYTEFSADRPQVVAGGNLEAAKQAFAESFVQRTAFTNLYPVTQTRDAFVDALIQSARQSSNVDLTTHRAELLSTYDAGTSLVNKRAVTLRKLI
ncbi:MAG TPA: NF038122 family metalloprotease, partial [Pyrinomonadaceae bacterium]|nr:NF038122 family metalloprotease [Pyrinomonadaceae bacterium]